MGADLSRLDKSGKNFPEGARAHLIAFMKAASKGRFDDAYKLYDNPLIDPTTWRKSVLQYIIENAKLPKCNREGRLKVIKMLMDDPRVNIAICNNKALRTAQFVMNKYGNLYEHQDIIDLIITDRNVLQTQIIHHNKVFKTNLPLQGINQTWNDWMATLEATNLWTKDICMAHHVTIYRAKLEKIITLLDCFKKMGIKKMSDVVREYVAEYV